MSEVHRSGIPLPLHSVNGTWNAPPGESITHVSCVLRRRTRLRSCGLSRRLSFGLVVFAVLSVFQPLTILGTALSSPSCFRLFYSLLFRRLPPARPRPNSSSVDDACSCHISHAGAPSPHHFPSFSLQICFFVFISPGPLGVTVVQFRGESCSSQLASMATPCRCCPWRKRWRQGTTAAVFSTHPPLQVFFSPPVVVQQPFGFLPVVAASKRSRWTGVTHDDINMCMVDCCLQKEACHSSRNPRNFLTTLDCRFVLHVAQKVVNTGNFLFWGGVLTHRALVQKPKLGCFTKKLSGSRCKCGDYRNVGTVCVLRFVLRV